MNEEMWEPEYPEKTSDDELHELLPWFVVNRPPSSVGGGDSTTGEVLTQAAMPEALMSYH